MIEKEYEVKEGFKVLSVEFGMGKCCCSRKKGKVVERQLKQIDICIIV